MKYRQKPLIQLIDYFSGPSCVDIAMYCTVSNIAMNGLEALSCDVHPRAGDQSVHKAALILFVVHNTWDGLTQNGSYYSGPRVFIL